MDRAVVTHRAVRATAECRCGVLLRAVAYACIGFIVSSVYVTLFVKHCHIWFGMLHAVIAILIVM